MTTYSNSLKLALIGDGEQTGVWGATTNTNLGTLLEQAICYQTSITMSAGSDYTLSNLNGAADESRSAAIIIGGVQSGSNSVICPAKQKLYIITNNLASSATAYFKPAGGTALAILTGTTVIAYCTGSSMVAVNYVDSSTYAAVAVGAANLTGGSANAIPYQSGVGATTYLAPGTAGFVLTSGGSGAAPYWNPSGTASLASNLAGGGAGQIVYQSGANTTQFLSAGSSGQLLQSNGSAAPSWTTFTGATQSGTNTFSGVNSFTNATPVTFGVAPTVGGSALITSSALSGYAALNANNTFTATGTSSFGGALQAQSFAALGAGSTGDQKFTVAFGGYNSGLAPNALQLGASGNGVLYLPSGAWDGSAGIGLAASFGAGNLQITATNTLYTGAANAYKTGSTTAWIIASDVRIKKNVTPYTKGLTELNQINIKNFEFNGLGNSIDGTKGLGVIADEIEQVLPSSVNTNKVKLNKDDAERVDLKHFDSTELVYLLVNSVKELSAKVDAQAVEIAALKAK
jgi:hypothetical protein